jgi:uncharacterized protein (DUF302 family)
MRLIVLLFALALLVAQPAAAQDHLVVKESPYGVGETLDRLAKIMGEKGITVFARIDHAAGAQKVGLELAPTELLIFGNPKLGTPLMQSNRRIGVDLPLKVLAYEDGGQTYIAYTDPAALKARYGVADRDKVFETMTGALNNLTNAATAQ